MPKENQYQKCAGTVSVLDVLSRRSESEEHLPRSSLKVEFPNDGEKTRIVQDTEGFDFVGRQFQRLSPMKFLMRPHRSSIRKHLEALSKLFRNHALPVGQQIQEANAIIRGFCNHYHTDHSSAVFRRLNHWTMWSFCKWVGRRSGKMTTANAYRKLTRVNGQKFTMPTAYTPAGKLVTLLFPLPLPTGSAFNRSQGANEVPWTEIGRSSCEGPDGD